MDDLTTNGASPNNPENQQQPKQDKKGFGIASMVLGIVSLLLGCMWFIAIPGAIVGLVLGISSNKAEKNGMATAGIILSIISLVFAALYVLGLGALIGLSTLESLY